MTIRRWVFAIVVVLCGWIGLQLLIMRYTDVAPGAVVLFPADSFLSNLPEGVAVVGIGSSWMSVKSDEPGLGKSLYAAGAWVVLPAGLPGCLSLSTVVSSN